MGEELVQQPVAGSQIFEELLSARITTLGGQPIPQIGSGLGEAKFSQVSTSQAPKVVQNVSKCLSRVPKLNLLETKHELSFDFERKRELNL